MKSRSLFVITVVMVALLFTLSAAAHAGPPKEAGGDFSYIASPAGPPKVAGGNMFIPSYDEAIWEGTFEGTSTEDGMVVLHCNGKVSFKGTALFVGEVDGRSGTLEISQVGQCCDEQGHWKIQWVILSGTDGLATLRGQGTMFGPGAGGFEIWGYQEYDGKYHFEPD